MIVAEKINKKYKDNVVINNLSLEIRDGEFVVITGKSGSGKSTLLNMLGLIEDVDSGVISIDGKKNFSKKEKMILFRKKYAFVFQNYALIDELTVKDNLLMVLEYSKCNKKTKLKKISNILLKVGMNGCENKKIYCLSGGEQQRIALARVMLKDSEYVFADEPTGNLDNDNKDKVISMLKELNDIGKTIIMVTHDKSLVGKDFVTRHLNIDKLNFAD